VSELLWVAHFTQPPWSLSNLESPLFFFPPFSVHGIAGVILLYARLKIMVFVEQGWSYPYNGSSVKISLTFCPINRQVIIITNSDEGWVKYSAERFVPRLLPVIENYKVVSARTRYEKFYPQSSLCWKGKNFHRLDEQPCISCILIHLHPITAAAFAHEVNELFEMNGAYCESSSDKSYDSLTLTDVSSASEDSLSPINHAGLSRRQSRREIISFGDGMEERTAVRIVGEQLSAIPKSVMFLQSPTPVQVIGQLLMLTNHMTYVCHHETSLDLEISLDQAEGCASRYFKRHNIRVDGDFMGSSGVAALEAESEHTNGVAVSVRL
jgi:hypothetical protein